MSSNEMRYLGRSNLFQYFSEMWVQRELLVFLVWKHVKVQFAQTALGVAWLIVRPLLNVIVLTFVFGRLAQLPSDGQPYLLFVLAGMLPWAYFSSVTNQGALVLLGNSTLITKIFFPRLFLPFSVAIAGLIDFLVTLVLFILISVFMYQQMLSFSILEFLVPLVLLLSFTMGACMWMSALAVDFRDVRHVTGYILQMLMFAAPVVWPVALLADRVGEWAISWFAWYPMVGVIEGFRHVLFSREGSLPWELLGPGFISTFVVLVTGFAYFRWRERQFADVV